MTPVVLASGWSICDVADSGFCNAVSDEIRGNLEVCHRYGFFYYSLEKTMPSDRGQPSWQRQVISDGKKKT